MAHKLLKLSLAVVVLVLIGLYISKNFEYYDQQVQLGWNEEARSKHYLAASKILAKQGVNLSRSARFDDSVNLHNVDVLLLPFASYIPHESQKERIVEWVTNGGHLIAGAETINPEGLLDYFGFYLDYINPVDSAETDDAPLSQLLREQNALLADSQGAGQDETLDLCLAPVNECDALTSPSVEADLLSEIELGGSEILYFNAEGIVSLGHAEFKAESGAYWSGNKNAITYAQVPVGNGVVSVFTDFSIFTNDELAHFDHAFILFQLLGFSEKPLLIYGWDAPSLFELLRKNLGFTFASSLLLLLLFLWHYSRRFGPIFNNPILNRRSQAERLQARSQFYWRSQNERALVGDLRNEIEARLEKILPRYSELSLKDKALLLSARSGLDAQQIVYAFDAKLNFQEEQFIQIVSTLKKIREID